MAGGGLRERGAEESDVGDGDGGGGGKNMGKEAKRGTAREQGVVIPSGQVVLISKTRAQC